MRFSEEKKRFIREMNKKYLESVIMKTCRDIGAEYTRYNITDIIKFERVHDTIYFNDAYMSISFNTQGTSVTLTYFPGNGSHSKDKRNIKSTEELVEAIRRIEKEVKDPLLAEIEPTMTKTQKNSNIF